MIRRAFRQEVLSARLRSAIVGYGPPALLAVVAILAPSALNEIGVSLGSSAIALALGLSVALATGINFERSQGLVRVALPVAIVLLGFDLDVSTAIDAEIGIAGGAAVAAAVVVSLGTAVSFGRWLRMSKAGALALGVGGAICGTAAVLAVAPVLRLKNQDLVMVLATVNLMGFLMFFSLVAIARVLELDTEMAGIWAGAAIHAVPQAIAAGEELGPGGAAIATAVKLSRVSLLIAVVPLLGLIASRGASGTSSGGQTGRLAIWGIPWFVPGFVAAALLRNLLVPEATGEALGDLGRLVLLPVIAAVGLTLSRSTLLHSGPPTVFVGLASSAVIGLATFMAIFVLVE